MHAAPWTCCQCFNFNAAQDVGLEEEQPGVIVKKREKVKIFLLLRVSKSWLNSIKT